MGHEVKLGDLQRLLEEATYPRSRAAIVDQYGDVTLLLADGTVGLGETLDASNVDTFESAGDVFDEVMNRLPRNAVGEPYQSEGEG